MSKINRLQRFPGFPIRSYDQLITRRFNPRKGRFLVAEPFMIDPNFKFTVVLLTEFSENGAMGFVLNRPTRFVLNDLNNDFKDMPPIPVSWGGPVEPNVLHYIHSYPDIPKAVPILPEEGIFWGGEFETIYRGLKRGAFSPDKIRFFIGYAGWMPAQLNKEMHEESWIVVPGKHEYVFDGPKDIRLWYKVLEDSGFVHKIITLVPPDPFWN